MRHFPRAQNEQDALQREHENTRAELVTFLSAPRLAREGYRLLANANDADSCQGTSKSHRKSPRSRSGIPDLETLVANARRGSSSSLAELEGGLHGDPPAWRTLFDIASQLTLLLHASDANLMPLVVLGGRIAELDIQESCGNDFAGELLAVTEHEVSRLHLVRVQSLAQKHGRGVRADFWTRACHQAQQEFDAALEELVILRPTIHEAK